MYCICCWKDTADDYLTMITHLPSTLLYMCILCTHHMHMLCSGITVSCAGQESVACSIAGAAHWICQLMMVLWQDRQSSCGTYGCLGHFPTWQCFLLPLFDWMCHLTGSQLCLLAHCGWQMSWFRSYISKATRCLSKTNIRDMKQQAPPGYFNNSDHNKAHVFFF